MSKILFTNTYFYRFDEKQWKTAQPYPPYGTMYAAACMRERGDEVVLFDNSLRESANEILPVLKNFQPDFLVIYDDGFNYLTKMCLTRMREAAFQMACWGKAAGCTVIVNSSDSSDHYEEYLAQGADFVIIGEGEITLRELISSIESNIADLSGIPGIAYRVRSAECGVRNFRVRSSECGVRNDSSTQLSLNDPGEYATPHSAFHTPHSITPHSALHTPHSKTLPRPVLHDLDSLPDPAWDLVDIEAYRDIWMRSHGYFTLNLATTRGCPYKCNWCAKPIYGNRYNSRSPERVVGEIKLLIEKYGVRHFWMADDIFGLKPGWVQRFRDLVLEQNLKFSYKIQSRVDLLLKEDSIDALVASGLQQVWVGAESGSQKILDAMDKGTQVSEIYDATALLKKKGVEVCFFLQFGYLGETRDDIEATMKMVDALQPHDIGISVSYPLPGTKFYEKVKGLLGEKQNWSVSDDLAMMYPATFSPEYYRRLHRLVHKRFRLRQGKNEWLKFLKSGKANTTKALKILYYAPSAALDAWRLRQAEQRLT